MLHEQMLHLNDIEIGSGLALLIAAALVGGLLEAVTRITWERWWLVKRCPPMDVLPNLTAENMEVCSSSRRKTEKLIRRLAPLENILR